MSEAMFVPSLRFSEFDGEWEEKRLGEISSDVMYGMNSAAIMFDGINKYIRITDIDEESRAFRPNPLTSPDGKLEEKYKLKNDDIVFTRTGASVGKSYMYQESDGGLYFAGFLIRFSITSANTKFVFQQTLRSAYEKWVLVMSMRSGQPGINAEEYKLLKLHLPEQQEQQKIADFMTAVDKRIEQLEEKKRLLSEYKKGVMQQIFSQHIRFTDDHPPGESLLPNGNSPSGNPYPDWQEKRFYDLLDEVLDFRGRTPKKIGMDWGNGSIVSLSANNVKNGYIDLESECNLGSQELYNKWMGKVNLVQGDIAFTMEAPLGKALLIPDSDKYILSQRVVAFKTKKYVSNPFLIQLIWSESFQNTITRLSTGSTAKGINQRSLKKVYVKLPAIQEQQKIADFLTVMDNKIDQAGAQLAQAKTFKKGLLQQMFV